MAAFPFAALAAGALGAGLFASLLLAPQAAVLIGNLSLLPPLWAAFSLGLRGALVALGGGALLLVGAGVGGGVLLYAALDGLPLLILGGLLMRWRADAGGVRHWYPPGRALAWLATTAVGLLGLLWALAPAHVDGIEGLLAERMAPVAEATAALFPPGERAEVADRLVAIWAPILPGVGLMVWQVRAVLCALLAQWVARRQGRALRPGPTLDEVALPGWLLGLLLPALGLAVLGDGDVAFLGRNAALVAAVPYLILGLVVIHAAVQGLARRRLLLGVFYVVLLLSSQWALIALSGLGLVEQTVGLRRRWRSGDGPTGR
ncbi:DUF2232 domain-containing protein [Roseospirillum parvum]|uniref:DUF2232 domain-containing protein n=1 Tax=Roseospirillum parvum TaxID=83401 RepID=A0A1G8B0N4_9PROT|nr:DUF2232 domain-containing protein [Roseospirillum parvum]SDH26691.1 hypothetical protein SAMN05421742_105167 [Roseospirillum parvum]